MVAQLGFSVLTDSLHQSLNVNLTHHRLTALLHIGQRQRLVVVQLLAAGVKHGFGKLPSGFFRLENEASFTVG